jgi:transcriptional regulator with XRE-family HTH domain
MNVGHRFRSLREEKDLSQGDVEEKTGLRRCYISRVENGHTVPSVKTLEKMAGALGMPLYQVLYDGAEPPASNGHSGKWGGHGKDSRYLDRLKACVSRMAERDRLLLIDFVEDVLKHQSERRPPSQA